MKRFVPVIATFHILLIVSCAAQVNEKKSHTRLELAKNFLSNGQLEAASREANIALEHNYKNAGAYYVLGTIEYLRAVANVQLLEVDECLTGVDAESLRSEMDADFRRAAGHFDQAVTLDDKYSEAFRNRGMVALHLEEFEDAKMFLIQALAVPHRLSSLALTRADLAWVLFNQGKHPEAAKELRQALQFAPNLCVANYRFGRVYLERGEFQKALDKFDSVIGDTECPMQEAHLFRIKTLAKLGQQPSAEAVEACVKLAPQSCAAAECQVGGQS